MLNKNKEIESGFICITRCFYV